jgi:hypothetical protein
MTNEAVFDPRAPARRPASCAPARGRGTAIAISGPGIAPRPSPRAPGGGDVFSSSILSNPKTKPPVTERSRISRPSASLPRVCMHANREGFIANSGPGIVPSHPPGSGGEGPLSSSILSNPKTKPPVTERSRISRPSASLPRVRMHANREGFIANSGPGIAPSPPGSGQGGALFLLRSFQTKKLNPTQRMVSNFAPRAPLPAPRVSAHWAGRRMW